MKRRAISGSELFAKLISGRPSRQRACKKEGAILTRYTLIVPPSVILIIPTKHTEIESNL